MNSEEDMSNNMNMNLIRDVVLNEMKEHIEKMENLLDQINQRLSLLESITSCSYCERIGELFVCDECQNKICRRCCFALERKSLRGQTETVYLCSKYNLCSQYNGHGGCGDP